MIDKFGIETKGQGLNEVTEMISSWLGRLRARDGLLTIFVQHTSASLLIQENADPTAGEDLIAFFNRIAPEGDVYEHAAEGPDDMPAHLKSALTASSLSIPVKSGEMMLGRWQGVYLFEHRHEAQARNIVLCFSEFGDDRG